MDVSKFLSSIPLNFRLPLLESYSEIGQNYLEHRWEPAELNGGKFCEAAYSILLGELNGKYLPAPTKPKNMFDAALDLERQTRPDPARIGDRSLRILIPRTILSLYEIRNNRGVGHIGGDVTPNLLNATAVYQMASWILAEFIRIFHSVSTQEAQSIVDTLVERKIPLIWEIEGTKRILDPKMKAKGQVLLFLYQSLNWVSIDDLSRWTEYSHKTNLTNKVVKPLHISRLIEYQPKEMRAKLSPLGAKYVETKLLPI